MRKLILINKIKKHAEISMIIISLILLQISNFFQWDTNPIMGFDKILADILIVSICCLLIKKLQIWDSAGFNKTGFIKGLLYGIPFIIIGIASVFVSNLGIKLSELNFLGFPHFIIFTINMILVGANEEIWMRSLVLNALISKYGTDKKSLWKAIIISAVIFGLIHIPNIFFMEPLTLLVQVINAMSAGILFAVIFIKSNNIWAGIIIHGLVDWCSLFVGNCFSGGNTVLSMNMTGSQAISIILAGSLPPIICSIIFMKKGHHKILQNNH